MKNGQGNTQTRPVFNFNFNYIPLRMGQISEKNSTHYLLMNIKFFIRIL